MRRFKSTVQAHRFVGVHAAVRNLFNLGRHLVAVDHYRTLRKGAFASWDRAVRFDGNPTAGDCGRAELTWQYPLLIAALRCV
jgi:hypothetical protein